MNQIHTISTKNNTIASALYMTVGSACFAAMAAVVKLASEQASTMQAVLFRSVFSAIPLLIIMRIRGTGVWSPRWKLLMLRGSLGFLALYCYFWSVARIPFANAIALQQMSPVLVALLAILLLGERPHKSYYVFATICSIGALLVVRPTHGFASLSSSVALLSALLAAGAYIAVRSLTKTEPTHRIVLWFSLVAAIGAMPIGLASWQPLSPSTIALLASAGILATVAQTLMTASYRRAPAHIASAFSYSNVPFAYAAGIVLWGERPDLIATVGIGLILCGGIAIAVQVRGS